MKRTRRKLQSLALVIMMAPAIPASALTVNTSADQLDVPAGASISLREAIRDTPAGGTIDFSAALNGGTSFLTMDELVLNKNLTIDASSLSDGLTLTTGGNRIMRIESSGVTLNNLTLTKGNSPDDGGAIHLSNNATLTLFDCLLRSNQAQQSGGGIYVNSSTLNLVRSVLERNTAATESGGGIFITGASSSLSLIGSSVQKNTAAIRGGAIQSAGNGSVSLSDSSLVDNTAGFGGGMNKGSGTVSITGCTIASNIATSAGGGLFLFPRVSGNITNSTVALNQTSGSGGGIVLDNDGDLEMESCTISENLAANKGGGIFTRDSTLDITNSIIAANHAEESDDLHLTGGSLTRDGSNLIGSNESAETTFPDDSPNTNGDYVGLDSAPLSPGLSPLGHFGGPTLSMPPLASSLAIDNGGATALSTDQRGFGRVIGASVDIGAVEAGTSYRVTTATDEDNGTLGSGAGDSLRECLAAATTPGSRVLFANALNGSTITLQNGDIDTSGQVVFVDASTLGKGITIDADNSSRCFSLNGTGSTLSLESLTLTKGGTRGNGGAIDIQDATLNLSNCTLSNHTSSRGGALHLDNSSLLASTSRFIDNEAEVGGAIESASNSVVFLDQCLFSENIASATAGIGKGGAIFSLISTFEISRCNFTGNNAFGPQSGNGGALYYTNSVDLTHHLSSITNSTFQGNSSIQGGGIYVEGTVGDITCRHLTIVGNVADAGGGLYVRRNGNALNFVSLDHCLIAGNISPFQPDIQYVDPTGGGGQLTSAGPNLIGNNDTVAVLFPEGPLAGTNVSPLDPMVGPPGNYGGPTTTRPLLAGSPAIDAGTPTSGSHSSDQRGLLREIGIAPDLGAYESGHLINYDVWALETIPSGLDSSFDGDSENDGHSNGIEYATGLNPVLSESGAILDFVRSPKPGGGHEALLTFPYNPEVPDIRYILQRSIDLESFFSRFNFNSATGAETLHPSGNVSAIIDPISGQISITDSDLTAGGGSRLYWRLKVQQIN